MPEVHLCPNGHPVPSADTVCPTCGTMPHTERVPPSTSSVLPALAGYEVLGELGQGGMGVVYKARHRQLKRLVAVKTIKNSAFAGAAERARFRAEAEAVARLQHPHIVQIHEIGEQDGLPFFTLEYMEGGSLARQLGGKPQPPQAAARLVQTLARAMHVAHQQGIIHRDLKPANVLLTADGQPKISDFGLAKRLEEGSSPTLSGAILGTPSYMAPEQALGKSQGRTLSPATDIYALGAILYEMLTGRPPFLGETPVDTLQQVVQDEPVAPRRLQPTVPRDLETICLKCLHKQAERRYGSAAALAEDLGRFLAGEPVHARPPGPLDRGLKWVRRRPAVAGLLAASVLAAVALVASVVGFVYQTDLENALAEAREQEKQAQVQKGIAEEQSREAEKQKATAEGQKAEADKQKRRAEASQQIAEQQRAEAARQRSLARRYQYVSDINMAQRAWKENQLLRLRNLLPRLVPAQGEAEDLRGFDWYLLQRICFAELATLPHTQPVAAAAISPDGRLVAGGCHDIVHHKQPGEVKLWEAVTGKEIRTLTGHTGYVLGLAFSPDGRFLAAACDTYVGKNYDHAGEVILWDLSTGKKSFVHLLPDNPAHCVAFSPDGQSLVSGHGQLAKGKFDPVAGPIRVWDPRTGRQVKVLSGHRHRLSSLAFRADGQRLASAAQDKTIRVWDPATGQEVLSIPDDSRSIAFHPDGRRLLGTSGGKLKIWEADSGKEIFTHQVEKSAIGQLAVSPDGQHLALATRDQSNDEAMRIWDLAARREVLVLPAHTEDITCLVFSPDGTRLVSGSGDRTLKVWDVTTPPESLTLPGLPDSLKSLAFPPDGRQVFSATNNGEVKTWNLQTGEELSSQRFPAFIRLSGALSPDASRLAVGVGKALAKVFDRRTGKELCTLQGHRQDIFGLAISLDNGKVATGSLDQSIKVWDATTGKEIRTLPGHKRSPGGFAPVSSVALSPDGKYLASATGIMFTSRPEDSEILVWDLSTGQVAHRLDGHLRTVQGLAFSPDSKWLASASEDRTVRLWDLATGNTVFTLEGHTFAVDCVVFSPDGRRLASGSLDGTVRLWDVVTGEPVQVLTHGSRVLALAFNPQGDCLAGGGFNAITLWFADKDAGSARAARRATLEPRTLVWHRRQAQAATRDRQWLIARFHLDRLLARTKPTPYLYARRADALAELEQWDLAEKDLLQVIALDTKDAWAWRLLACLGLRTGNRREEHRQFCQKMVGRFGNTADPQTAGQVAWTCVLVPRAVADLEPIVGLAEKAHSQAGFVSAHGAALFRAGRYPEALPRLHQALKASKKEGTAFDWLFLAMTYQRLSKADEARQWLAKAAAWLDQAADSPGRFPLYWDERIALRLLRQEAETVVWEKKEKVQ